MISAGMEELAKDMGLRMDDDVAYGLFGGYAAALSETPKWKDLVFSTQLLEDEKKAELNSRCSDRKRLRGFGIHRLECQGAFIRVLFDNKGDVMENMRRFIDWFVPILNELGAVKGDLCVQCGQPVKENHPWLLVDDTAYHMHEKCAEKVERKARNRLVNFLAEDDGVLSRGIIGAIVGALLGVVVWCIAANMGMYAPVAGIFTVWLCQLGYDLARGPRDMSKVWTILIVSIVGVLLGCLVSDGYTIYTLLQSGQLTGSAWGIPRYLWLLILDGEYLGKLVVNFLVGTAAALLALLPIYRARKIELDSLQVKTRRLN